MFQYLESKPDVIPSSIYGVVHLIRLLGKVFSKLKKKEKGPHLATLIIFHIFMEEKLLAGLKKLCKI